MRQWKIKEQNEKMVAALQKGLGCTHFFARILINRGINEVEQALEFLNTSDSDLLDPYLFEGMSQAVERIGRAIGQHEKITVYGDYDVDGITATGLLVEAIRALGGDAEYYIPSRFTEGYGVNSSAIRAIAAGGTRLIITVDTGITAVAEVEEAKRLGLEIIITDHHECQRDLPDTRIINPKYTGCRYPFPDLAGVGVAYKMACALDQKYGSGEGARRFTSFAAIGTVADIMPLRGENRFIVRRGLEDLKETSSIGLKLLMDRCVGDKPVDTAAIGFMIAPRINAAGRLGSAEAGVELLITHDRERAQEIVDQLCAENNRRQEIEAQILEEAISMIERDPDSEKRGAIVLWQEGWHNGVIGIVASRLKERYGKPCILFSVNGDLAKGSGRSIRPFNLFEALERISGICEKYGGHAYAAGLLVHAGRLPEFRDAFCREADLFLEDHAFDESIEVDCTLRSGDLTLDQIRALSRLAPFGRGNETPVFCMRGVELLDAAPTANQNHMRLVLQCGQQRTTAFYFNISPARFDYLPGDLIDIVFEAEINTYNGRQSVQLTIKDMRYSAALCAPMKTEIRRLKEEQILPADIPSREDAVALYRFLYLKMQQGVNSFDFYTLPGRIACAQQRRLTVGNIFYALQILKELGILEYSLEDQELKNLHIHTEKRVSFGDSEILKNITEKAGDTVWA